MPKPTTRAEQETVFRWDEDDKVVHVWSASPVTWRKLVRLGIELQRETRRAGEVTGRFFASVGGLVHERSSMVSCPNLRHSGRRG